MTFVIFLGLKPASAIAIVIPLTESRSRQIENQPYVSVHDLEFRGRYTSQEFPTTPQSNTAHLLGYKESREGDSSIRRIYADM